MKKFLFVLFLLLAAGVVLVITGIIPASLFTAPHQEAHKNVDIGFVQLPQPEKPIRIQFDPIIDQKSYLGVDVESSNTEDTVKMLDQTSHIQLIRGYDLDAGGNASTWIFVVKQPEKVSLITYDRFGQKTSNWPGSYPEPVIDISGLLSPHLLFAQNRGILFRTPSSESEESRELAVVGDKYYLTITDKAGMKRQITFNAKTGAMVSPND